MTDYPRDLKGYGPRHLIALDGLQGNLLRYRDIHCQGQNMRKATKPKPLKIGVKANSRGKRSGLRDESIHLELSKAIVDHRIPPGTALQEDALSTAFGVSRTVIRKVLQKLSHERLVDLAPNKGATVARPSAEEAKEVFDARRLIEKILVERVVATADDGSIDELGKLGRR